ncbi:Uncharacterized protein SCF082_LOCUS39767 [Durusdinium trenchii]|uniref:Uncharacterized protein n=1 Tax=Durusdinium trenchii TaxID=1381693 RepID=A0ABP0Q6E5_9DINO
MPSAWNPFLYISTAFNTIDKVKFVPGAKNPEKPEFIDRFLFWRRCALRVGVWASLIWLFLSLNEFQQAWRDVRGKLQQFPMMVRVYFERFIYAELFAQTLSEMAAVVAVFVFMRAWKEQDNFERSSDLTRLGWFFNTMGPFLPYLLIPLSFFFRIDYFQRDVCASIIGMLAHDPISSLVFSEAASQASEQELAAALANPMAKPPRFGEPGFDESPAAAWCWRFYADWQPRLFSEEWMGSAMSDVGDGHNVKVPNILGTTYPGVVPQALKLLAAMFGAGHTMSDDFCAEKEQETVITKDNMQAVGAESSLLEQGAGWLHWTLPDSDDPMIISLRQKLIKVYQNVTHRTPSEAAWAHQLLKEVRAASMTSFQQQSAGGFYWPLPDAFHPSQKASPGRKKFFRGKGSAAVDFGGDVKLNPEELLQTDGPDMSIMASGLGKQAICTFKSLMIAAMKMCAFCYILVTTTVSMYCAVSYSLGLASLIIGVIDGLGAGVANVKAILYRSCLPGYLQSITAFVTLPGILFILVFFSQIGGSPLLSLAMCCLAVWRALDFYMGEIAIDIKSPKKLEKAVKRIGKHKSLCLMAAAVCFIAHTMWLLYSTRVNVKMDTSGAKDAMVKGLQDPFKLLTAITKMIYVRVFTNLVTTNWIMEAVFDAADDNLKVKSESGKHVEDSWAKLTKGKRKKKKKKKHESEEEEGYYDEEGWYYPPPGEEMMGEVPEMPPATGEGEAEGAEVMAEGAEGAEGEAGVEAPVEAPAGEATAEAPAPAAAPADAPPGTASAGGQ